MCERESEVGAIDYPVNLSTGHEVTEGTHYDGDRFECNLHNAYMHTGGWPTWSYCPFCGAEVGGP